MKKQISFIFFVGKEGEGEGEGGGREGGRGGWVRVGSERESGRGRKGRAIIINIILFSHC